MAYPADACTNAQNAMEAQKQYEYERSQLKAAASQSNPLDPWRDSKGNITDFGGLAGVGGFGSTAGLAGSICKAPSAVNSQDLIDVQRRLLSLLGAVNELLARMGGR